MTFQAIIEEIENNLKKILDELSISEKVDLDIEYLNRRSIWLDFKILLVRCS